MKLIKPISFVLVSLVLSCLSGCLKKGEDDPLISLRTRKERLEGLWRLTSGTEEKTNLYTDSLGKHESTTTLKYTKTGYQDDGRTGFVFYNYGSYTLEFGKKGEFELIKKYDDRGNAYTSKGTWNFEKGIGDYKNKEQVVINLISTTYFDLSFQSGFGHTYTGNKSNITYTLKELRNKKLVIVSEYSYIQSDGYGMSSKSELTFEQ